MRFEQTGYKLSIKAEVCEGEKFSTFGLELPHKAVKASESSKLFSVVTSFWGVVDFCLVLILSIDSDFEDEFLLASSTRVGMSLISFGSKQSFLKL